MITKISTPKFNLQKQNRIQNSYNSIKSNNDCFTPSFSGTKQKKASVLSILKDIFTNSNTEIKPFTQKDATRFQIKMAEGIKKTFELNIPPQNFENIMSNEEFKKLLPTLKEENFTYNNDYSKNTLYKIDLDNQTIFSSANGILEKKLEEIEEHAKKYYEKTGEKFIFSAADKDDLNGSRHIIRIIGENPEKFQHFKFLPATKLAFTHEAPESGIGFENSELLLYGINPFSENIEKLLNKTIEKRKEMITNFVEEIDKYYPDFEFDTNEFSEQNDLLFNKSYTQSNLYWRIREYAEGKGGNALKKEGNDITNVYQQADDILNTLGLTLFGNEDLYGTRSSNIDTKDEDFTQTIRRIFRKYSTHIDEETGKIVSAAENNLEEIMTCIKKEAKEDRPIIAFASPYYLSHHYEKRGHDQSYKNVIDFMKKVIKASDGMIIAFESISPTYIKDEALPKERIDKFNETIRKNLNLYEVGGSFQAKEFVAT